jgi:hypothetical protein
VKTWIRIALIVVLAIVLWYLVIDTTEQMTGGGTAGAPAAPAAPAPAPVAPN